MTNIEKVQIGNTVKPTGLGAILTGIRGTGKVIHVQTEDGKTTSPRILAEIDEWGEHYLNDGIVVECTETNDLWWLAKEDFEIVEGGTK